VPKFSREHDKGNHSIVYRNIFDSINLFLHTLLNIRQNYLCLVLVGCILNHTFEVWGYHAA